MLSSSRYAHQRRVSLDERFRLDKCRRHATSPHGRWELTAQDPGQRKLLLQGELR